MNLKNILNKISYYFKDCYGVDNLTMFLLIIGLILSLFKYVQYLGAALALYGLFRTFSKNKYKRGRELAVFENFTGILKQQFYSRKASFDEAKKYKILKCPKCSQKLRIPRHKGKIVVTCKKCGHEFKAKS